MIKAKSAEVSNMMDKFAITEESQAPGGHADFVVVEGGNAKEVTSGRKMSEVFRAFVSEHGWRSRLPGRHIPVVHQETNHHVTVNRKK